VTVLCVPCSLDCGLALSVEFRVGGRGLEEGSGPHPFRLRLPLRLFSGRFRAKREQLSRLGCSPINLHAALALACLNESSPVFVITLDTGPGRPLRSFDVRASTCMDVSDTTVYEPRILSTWWRLGRRRPPRCITQLKAQGPSRTCNESTEEEEKMQPSMSLESSQHGGGWAGGGPQGGGQEGRGSQGARTPLGRTTASQKCAVVPRRARI